MVELCGIAHFHVCIEERKQRREIGEKWWRKKVTENFYRHAMPPKVTYSNLTNTIPPCKFMVIVKCEFICIRGNLKFGGAKIKLY